MTPEETRSTIVDAMKRLAWVLAWIQYEQEQGRGSYPGQDLFDVAPEVPEAERENLERYVFQAVQHIENESRKLAQASQSEDWTIEALFARAYKLASMTPKASIGRLPSESELAKRFGHCLIFAYQGHGVSWEDDYPAPAFLKIPHGDSFYYFGEDES